jgi:glycosyltransferase involved in cell wall biosynthesis
MKLLVVSHACVVDMNQRLYSELERLGHEVSVVVPDRWRHAHAAGQIRPVRLRGFTGPLITVPVWNAGSVPLHVYLGRLTAVLKDRAPDVLYIDEEPYSVAAFQWAWASARLSTTIAFFTAQNVLKRYPLFFRLSEQFVWRRSALGICVTASVAHTLRARGYTRKTYVVPPAVDVERFRPRAPDPNLRSELGLRPLVIAYLGRLVAEKGVKVLLAAYRRLPNRLDTSLMLLGGGPLGDECRAVPGAVVVDGLRHSQIPEYLALADIVVLPSLTTPGWKEQFGRAAVEAMACGLPVIGSDSGEIPNVVRKAGGGFIVAEGNVNALATAAAVLLEDRESRRSLGQRGREHVRKEYSTAVVAGKLATALANGQLTDQ